MGHRRRSIATVAEIRTRSIGADFLWEARMMGGAFHVELSSEEFNAIFTIINQANERALDVARTAEADCQPAGKSVSVLSRRRVKRHKDGATS